MTSEATLEKTVSLLRAPLGNLVQSPLVSVLMSNYNYGAYIGEAIESVVAQTYGQFELLVCDDGSKDNSCETVERYVRQDRRVRLLRKENGGQASGYNTGYRESRGLIIAFIDSDDIWMPQKLERVVQAFQAHPESGLIAHRLLLVDEKRRRRGVWPLRAHIPDGWQAPALLRNGGILEDLPPGGGLALRREIAERIFPLPEHGALRSYGDIPPMRLAPLMTSIVSLSEPLTEWRRHGQNFANGSVTLAFIRRELEAHQAQWNLQRQYLEMVHPSLANGFAPLDASVHMAAMKYMEARFEGRTAVGLHRELMRRYCGEETAPKARKWFWRMSIWFPKPFFRLAVNLFTRPNVLKQALSRLITTNFEEEHR
jgi:hypothetical protein